MALRWRGHRTCRAGGHGTRWAATSRLFVQRFFLALSRHLAAEAGSSGPVALANRELPAMER